jgi:hypothetical protein
MVSYKFDMSLVTSFSEWLNLYVAVVNGDGVEFMEPSRSGYSDALAGGCGSPLKPCQFVFVNLNIYDHEEYTSFALSDLQRELEGTTSDEAEAIRKTIEATRRGAGKSLLDWILEPVRGQQDIELVIKWPAEQRCEPDEAKRW